MWEGERERRVMSWYSHEKAGAFWALSLGSPLGSVGHPLKTPAPEGALYNTQPQKQDGSCNVTEFVLAARTGECGCVSTHVRACMHLCACACVEGVGDNSDICL